MGKGLTCRSQGPWFKSHHEPSLLFLFPHPDSEGWFRGPGSNHPSSFFFREKRGGVVQGGDLSRRKIDQLPLTGLTNRATYLPI